MNGINSTRPALDPALLNRLRERLEAANRAFELASDNEKPAALLRLDRVTTEFTEALLYGKLPSKD